MEKESQIRRQVLALVAVTFNWFALTSLANAQERTIGEPYELLGNRIYFTDWGYIHPGVISWQLNGKTVHVSDDLEPDKATLKSKHEPRGIEIVVEKPQRRGPLIKSVEPWESRGIIFTTVMKDGKTYKAWGTCKGDEIEADCYFESSDGVHWNRPKLDVVKLNGRETNLLRTRPYQPWIRISHVFKDPSADPTERYKMVRQGFMSSEEFEKSEFRKRRPDDWEEKVVEGNRVRYIQGGVSPDGVHWTMLPGTVSSEGPPRTTG